MGRTTRPCPGVTVDVFSARFDATVTASTAGSYEFAVRTNGAARLWVDDHILVDTSCQLASVRGGVSCSTWAMPLTPSTQLYAGGFRSNITRGIESGLHLRVEWLHYGGDDATIEVMWRPSIPTDEARGGHAGEEQRTDVAFEPIPPSALSPTLTRAEEWRQRMQSDMSRGWNTWSRDSAARHVHLPTAVGIEVVVFDPASGESWRNGLVDKCHGADAGSCKVRVPCRTSLPFFSFIVVQDIFTSC